VTVSGGGAQLQRVLQVGGVVQTRLKSEIRTHRSPLLMPNESNLTTALCI
jgi:hypothetical protein